MAGVPGTAGAPRPAGFNQGPVPDLNPGAAGTPQVSTSTTGVRPPEAPTPGPDPNYANGNPYQNTGIYAKPAAAPAAPAAPAPTPAPPAAPAPTPAMMPQSSMSALAQAIDPGKGWDQQGFTGVAGTLGQRQLPQSMAALQGSLLY